MIGLFQIDSSIVFASEREEEYSNNFFCNRFSFDSWMGNARFIITDYCPASGLVRSINYKSKYCVRRHPSSIVRLGCDVGFGA